MVITDWPVSWYPVTTTEELKVGTVQVHQLGNNELVVARGESGLAFAIDALCPHMGAHLRHAKVIGESLRCPLHHWRLTASENGDKETVRHRAWPVREQIGIVYVGFSNNLQQLPALPGTDLLKNYYWTTGKPTDVSADWKAAIINGFDLTHLSAVHHRELLDEPGIDISADKVQLKYQSRVIGNSLADRFTRLLSDDCVRVEQDCVGTTIVVRSQLKQISTAAIVSILPINNGVRVFTVFGVRHGPLAFIRGQLARELFTRFLRKDIKILEGMRLRLDRVDDAGVKAVAQFLVSLAEGPVVLSHPAEEQQVSYVSDVSTGGR